MKGFLKKKKGEGANVPKARFSLRAGKAKNLVPKEADATPAPGSEKRQRQPNGPMAPGPSLDQVIGQIDEVCHEQERLIKINDEKRYDGGEGVIIGREPANNRERMLFKWARHIDSEGRTYEECPKCGAYNFFETRYSSDTIIFRCTGCDTKFALTK